jgi:hypothetical protein
VSADVSVNYLLSFMCELENFSDRAEKAVNDYSQQTLVSRVST